MSTATDRDNKDLLAQARSRATELALLNHINRALTSTLDYSRVLLLILSEVNGILGVEAASVSLVDEEKGDLVFEYAVGKGADAVRGMHMPLQQGVLGWVVTHGEPEAAEHFAGLLREQKGWEVSVPQYQEEAVLE